MKNLLLLFLILFSNVIFGQNINYKNDSLNVFLSDLSDNNLSSYFSIKFYKRGPVKLHRFQDGSCNGKGTINKIFVFWHKNQKSYIKKFDDCSSYQEIEISKFPIEFINDYQSILNHEKPKEYHSTVIYDNEVHLIDLMHTKGRVFNFYFESQHYKIHIDLNDFSNPEDAKNSNFEYNSKLKIFALSEFCEKLIIGLEKNSQFIKIE